MVILVERTGLILLFVFHPLFLIVSPTLQPPTIEELYEKAEAIIANKDEIISGLEARIAELEHSVLAGDADDFPAEYENHGVFTMVAKMVLARASVPEIMKALDNEKEFLSQREVGYFFHPSPEGKAANTLRNYTKNNKAR